MKAFTKSMLAVSGLALSLAACGPGFKGEGSKKPNLQKIFMKEQRELQEAAKQTANVAEVKRGDKTDNGYEFEITLANVPDVAQEDQTLSMKLISWPLVIMMLERFLVRC